MFSRGSWRRSSSGLIHVQAISGIASPPHLMKSRMAVSSSSLLVRVRSSSTKVR